jgi:uncharacterized membrane protein
MKKYFLAGLVILLPLALTLIVVLFVFNLLTKPFVDVLHSIFNYYGVLQNGFLFFNAQQVREFISQVIIFALLFFFTAFIGLLGRLYLTRSLIKMWDYVIHRIPIIRTVYKTCQEVINTIFATKTKSFKQVVMVPFPDQNTYSIGLVTQENIPNFTNKPLQELTAVFVPTTPNPTSGFLMMFEEKDLIHLDMTIEEAFKYIISCGVVPSPFREVSKEKAHEIAAQREEDEEKFKP